MDDWTGDLRDGWMDDWTGDLRVGGMDRLMGKWRDGGLVGWSDGRMIEKNLHRLLM